jgi:GNAT superfamily N-acetyltransferase
LAEWVAQQPPSVEIGILLIGDRLSVVDEAAAVVVDGEIVAVSTIAPRGEQLSGQPTIVTLYTKPAYRKQGHGAVAFQAAIARCRKRGFLQVRVDVMSGYAMRIIESLSEADRDYLIVNDQGSVMDFLGKI